MKESNSQMEISDSSLSHSSSNMSAIQTPDYMSIYKKQDVTKLVNWKESELLKNKKMVFLQEVIFFSKRNFLEINLHRKPFVTLICKHKNKYEEVISTPDTTIFWNDTFLKNIIFSKLKIKKSVNLNRK